MLSERQRAAIDAHFSSIGPPESTAGQSNIKPLELAAALRSTIDALKQQLPAPTEATTPADRSSGREDFLDSAIQSILGTSKLGGPEERVEIIRQYPELAAELTKFFDDYDLVTLWFLAVGNDALESGNSAKDGDGYWIQGENSKAGISLGRYQLQDILGSGGQGVVYKAFQIGAVQRVVALKTLRAEAMTTQTDVVNFLREMRLMTELEHPGIVSILDSGIEQGRPFLAMPLMTGGSLANNIRNEGQPDLTKAAKWMAEIARAVQYLHERNMVHRDLKPSNILFDSHDQPRVADFGLMRLVEKAGGSTAHNSMQVLEGTASYMAPEQAAGNLKQVGRRTDIYGMGAILYEMLTGRPPFRTDSFLKTLAKVIDDDPTTPRSLRPEIPVELEAICLKSMAKAPAKRYESAGDLAEELDRFRLGIPLALTHPPGLLARIVRWARREPGLATRLFVVFGVTAVILFNWLSSATGMYSPRTVGWSIGPFSGDAQSLRWVNLSFLTGWGLAAFGFQAALRRSSRAATIIRAWMATDIALMTLILMVDGHPTTPLTAIYYLLIGASGLWSRVPVVGFTTVLAVIGYILLVLEGWASGKPIGYRYGYIDFTAGLVLMGLVTAYQARRVRALANVIDDAS